MPTFNTTATLDGINPFDIQFFGTFSWSNNFLRTVDLWNNTPDNIHNIDLTLSGNNLSMREFNAHGGAVYNITMTDADSDSGRFLDLLRFRSTGSLTVDFEATQVRAMSLRDGTFDIDLGRGMFDSVEIGNAVSTTVMNDVGGRIVSLRIENRASSTNVTDIDIDGRANHIRINRGENDIDVTGRIDNLTVNDAESNLITVAAGGRIENALLNGIYDPVTDSFSQRSDNDINVQGRIDYLRTWAGDNTIDLGGAARIRTMVLDESITNLTLASGAYVEQLSASGDTTIDVQGDGQIESMRLFRGTQTVTTGTEWGDAYNSYLSTNTLNIGTGGLNSITFSDAVGHQSLTAAGFINSVRLNGNNTATMTFNAGIAGVLAFGGTTYTINIGAGTPSGYNGTIQAFGSESTIVNTGAGDVAAILTGAGADVITTGTGRIGGIDTGEGDDLITLGAGGAEAAAGNDGNDTLVGSDVEDALYGGADSDTLTGGLANDTLFGGTGTDRAEGGDGDDLIEGGASSDTLYGDAGNDTILGGSSADRMYGGIGDDLLEGGSSADTVYGGDGADAILGGSSGDSLFGGNQNDTISGGTSNDTISGGGHNDLIHGDDGNDSLLGDGSSDTIHGGLGDDFIDGGTSADELYGDAGADSILGGSSADVIYGGTENDTIQGGSSDDTVYGGSHSDLIHGDDGNDSLMGDGSADTIHGGAGTDVIDGGSSADVLYGGSSADTIFGGSSNDTIYGGSSGDVMTGGTGRDVFVFDTGIGTSIDVITDFTAVDDTIWLENAVFAGLAPGVLLASAFVANTSGGATTAAHRLIYETDTGALSFDADGNGAGAAVQFATLGTGLALTHDDFFVI